MSTSICSASNLTLGFRMLPICHAHLHEQVLLPQHHRDPFDRMLITQARVEALTLVTCDPAFTAKELCEALRELLL